MTASESTLQKRAIFSRTPAAMGRSVRQSRMSGWMPISRNLPTLCWVGFVFSSSAARMYGTSVR